MESNWKEQRRFFAEIPIWIDMAITWERAPTRSVEGRLVRGVLDHFIAHCPLALESQSHPPELDSPANLLGMRPLR